MKKLTIYALALLLTSVSCNDVKSQDLSPEIQKSIDEKLYISFSGKAFVKYLQNNSMVLLFRTTAGTGDDYDKAFVISSETPVPQLTLNETDDFKIFVPQNRRYVVLYNRTKGKIHFIGLSEDATSQKISAFKSNTSLQSSVAKNDYLGYGMAYLNGKWSKSKTQSSQYKLGHNVLASSDMNQPDSVIPPDDEGNSCAAGRCTSGGPGASSCAITEPPWGSECSVTCTAGYYACCYSPTTKCYCCKN